MNEIKFSEDYMKLPVVWNGTQAVLMAVRQVDVNKIKNSLPQFIHYDTAYRQKIGNYDLNFKDGLILFFIHINTGVPFTTIRNSWGNKYNYYAGKVGETFKLVKT